MFRFIRIAAPLIAAMALFGWWSGQHAPAPAGVDATAEPVRPELAGPAGEPDRASLPPEAIATLQAIERGGPFPYDRDGVTFQNREGRLPERSPGYYREYTVPTPGASNRGARRIVAGGDPPEVYYYTDDHYRTFRRVDPGK